MAPNATAVTAAFICTSLISAAPNVLLFLFPNYGASSAHDPMLSLGSALAVGGLLGDGECPRLCMSLLHTLAYRVQLLHRNYSVFLHTLPDAFAEAKEEDGGGEGVGTRCLVGFLLFLLMDILMRSLQGGHSHHHNDKGDSKHEHAANKKSVILLNLVGDAMHNFTDGLAIGASFGASDVDASQSITSLVVSKGGLASISVFLHEVPHELGDFATLVNAGLSRNQAVMCQFLTALGAFLGTAAGLFAGSLVDGLGHDFLLPFTAGGFVYLACVTILPEILDAEASFTLRLMQIGSFLIGLGFMFGVLIVEEWEGTDGNDEL
ncbi:hypothetical protein THAOC_05015 [Thalassiosira oceanica]|uniref:Uncharacterized protein n=1 Tax=Thalassiosira oceanica TaxID=159749 RepID=K0THZ1_THAOC|nr:hypothetical protein THAOC_05015 [Thalassiosira oceanica]|eukprot:EJK73366.1 hypothetical protein THAOC_05015 [Thalassiosira oceanica]